MLGAVHSVAALLVLSPLLLAGVFLVASLGSTVALQSIGGAPWWGGIVCGAVAAGVEGVSNHGLDNLTVQLVPSLVAAALFGP